MDLTHAQFSPFGENGILLRFQGDWKEANLKVAEVVHSLAERGSFSVVAGISSLLFSFKAEESFEERVLEIRDLLKMPEGYGRKGKEWKIPLLIDGPDLPSVLETKGLAMEQLEEIFLSHKYRVLMIGFSPGFPYLGPLPPSLQTLRRAAPRTRVPKGSVAIASHFAGIYPQETGGGWNLIGRTPLRIFLEERADPFLLGYGDEVTFSSITPGEFERLEEKSPSLEFHPEEPALELLSSGICTTMQDHGRHGFQHMGIPPSGPMDKESFQCGNFILGNREGSPSLEFSFPAPALKAHQRVRAVLTGADFSPLLGEKPVPLWAPFEMEVGETLQFPERKEGIWCYLSVHGGFDAPLFLGSASTFIRGKLGAIRPLKKEDLLGCARLKHGPAEAPRPAPSGLASIPTIQEVGEVPFAPLPEIPEYLLREFVEGSFTVSHEIDRGGFRLKGIKIQLPEREVLPEPNTIGAIQIPPSGDPIVILNDGPPTGGYPKIGVIPQSHLRKLTQLSPGKEVSFVLA